MSIDMQQFRETYITESLEGLDDMESNLLELQPGSSDSDAINTIFRAAHSIKGGGATFGFAEVSNFTHVVETLLDQIRNGEREVTQQAIDLFLESVDCLREMMAACREGESGESERTAEVKHKLDAMYSGKTIAVDASAPLSSDTEAGDDAQTQSCSWKIYFKPDATMLMTGNDVVRIFQELDSLGELHVEADLDLLPGMTELNPEYCYLAWRLTLQGNVERHALDEVFAWVEDECELTIEPLATVADSRAAQLSDQTISVAKEATPASVNTAQSTDNAIAAQKKKTSSAETSSIRVGIEKVDDLINMVGELVITQSMLSQLSSTEFEEFDLNKYEKMRDGMATLERNTRELQESVMRIRMLPISFTFNRFPRMVHDMCKKLNKKIELKLTGEGTELDKTVLEKIGDPLVHLVRNSCDHGIELPEQRLKAGKPETGTVQLDAFHQGGDIVINIIDDGAGLHRDKIFDKAVQRGLVEADAHLSDAQIYDLLFQPGFSTAEAVTDVSGRGVGMDVVRKNIQALGGRVDVSSKEGEGSTFTIRLPLTLAILDGQLIRVGKECYIVPLVSIIESLQLQPELVSSIAGKAELYRLRDEYLPIIRLYDTFKIQSDFKELTEGLVVVVETGDGKRAGLFIDDLLSQQQVVIKSLETNFKSVYGISGATILGDGTVALIVDVTSLIRLAHNTLDEESLQGLSQADLAA